VVAASPAGARLRIVIAPGKRAEVEKKIAEHGATLRKVTADFEDLFLARLAGSSDEPRGQAA
jgi:ABC-2 type transport system ATP-binding protein